MSLLQALAERPWLPGPEPAARALPAAELAQRARRSALRVFLAVVVVLFTLMLMAYIGRMAYVDWRPAPQIRLLWANSAVLALASVGLQWALLAARRGHLAALRTGTLAAAGLTLVFVYGQLLAWSQLAAMELVDIRNPSVGFFYMITGTHAAHMLGGLVALGRTARRAFATGDTAALARSLANCALYWHVLLAVWLVLFGLLFSGNNFELLLEICGIR